MGTSESIGDQELIKLRKTLLILSFIGSAYGILDLKFEKFVAGGSEWKANNPELLPYILSGILIYYTLSFWIRSMHERSKIALDEDRKKLESFDTNYDYKATLRFEQLANGLNRIKQLASQESGEDRNVLELYNDLDLTKNSRETIMQMDVIITLVFNENPQYFKQFDRTHMLSFFHRNVNDNAQIGLDLIETVEQLHELSRFLISWSNLDSKEDKMTIHSKRTRFLDFYFPLIFATISILLLVVPFQNLVNKVSGLVE